MFEVIGHRGAGTLEPENTLVSFIRAFELGCPRVELDIHLTKDKKAAVIHNPFLDKTTNGTGLIINYTLHELQNLDAGRGTGIPELSEVFECFVDKDLRFQIELKGAGSEDVVPEIVKEFHLEERIRYTSFVHRRVKCAVEASPGSEGGLLMSAAVIDPVTLLKEAGVEYLHLSKWNLSGKLVDNLHHAGMKIIAWENIVGEEDFRRLVEWKVDGATTDRPDLFLEFIQRYQPGSLNR